MPQPHQTRLNQTEEPVATGDTVETPAQLDATALTEYRPPCITRKPRSHLSSTINRATAICSTEATNSVMHPLAVKKIVAMRSSYVDTCTVTSHLLPAGGAKQRLRRPWDKVQFFKTGKTRSTDRHGSFFLLCDRNRALTRCCSRCAIGSCQIICTATPYDSAQHVPSS